MTQRPSWFHLWCKGHFYRYTICNYDTLTKEPYELSVSRFQMMLEISKKDNKVCKRIIKADLHADMLRNLSCETLSAETLGDRQWNAKRDELVTYHIRILYAVVKKTETARDAFRKCHAVDVLQKYCDVAKYPVISLFSNLMQHIVLELHNATRNVLDCGQSNYSSRVILSCTFTLPNTNRTG